MSEVLVEDVGIEHGLEQVTRFILWLGGLNMLIHKLGVIVKIQQAAMRDDGLTQSISA